MSLSTSKLKLSTINQLTRVDSSLVYAFGYDEATQTLEVIFYKTGIHRYRNVPKSVYDGLIHSESKGRYVLANVVDVFRYERL